MGKRLGFGEYQYELVEDWPKTPIRGAAADVAVDAEGRVYVGVRNPKPDGSAGTSRTGVGHVVVLDRDGRELRDWGNVFTAPHGVWINREGEIFVADAGGHTITKHAPSGEVLLTLGTKGQPGAPGAPFNLPTHAVQAPNGDIVVSDGYGQNRIHRFTSGGEHVLSFGSGNVVFQVEDPGPPSTGPGEFNVPHDLVVDEDSRIMVMDRENNRWQVFTLDGELLSICAPVTRPNKTVFDAAGVMHIAGGAGIEVWTRDGTRLGSWGEKGSGPGQFVTGSVHGAWMDAEGSIYTAEAGYNNRLQKFARV